LLGAPKRCSAEARTVCALACELEMTAAAARKLQKDIDVVLKKVDDGLEEFGQVWEQATTSSSGSQKEKLGEELKRSINKLQRLRAQIREWIGQSDVKNNPKDKLEEARRRIEADMQRFKEFERDLKTKAFSTCALARDDDLDIEEAEKIKYQEYLTSTIQILNDQLDELEADIEMLGNKKSLSPDEKSRSGQLRIWQDRHRWHIKKLELILRALDNDNIDMSDLAVIRESVEVYIDNHQNPDYGHDEGLYDCFDLTEFEDRPQGTAGSRTPGAEGEGPTGNTPKEEPQKKSKEKDKRKKDEKKDRKREEREKKAAASPAAGASASKANGGGGKGDPKTPTGQGSSQGNSSDRGSDCRQEKKVLDDINLDETKVQEDQLLSEAEEFICKICQIHVVGCSPKLTNCSHLFCGDCIAQWFDQHPQSQTWAQRAKSAGKAAPLAVAAADAAFCEDEADTTQTESVTSAASASTETWASEDGCAGSARGPAGGGASSCLPLDEAERRARGAELLSILRQPASPVVKPQDVIVKLLREAACSRASPELPIPPPPPEVPWPEAAAVAANGATSAAAVGVASPTAAAARGAPVAPSPLKAKLRSSASLFVPGGSLQQQGAGVTAPLEDGKSAVRRVLQQAFGGCLRGLSLKEAASHTEVAVTLSMPKSLMCVQHSSVAVAERLARTQATRDVLESVNLLGTHVQCLEPSYDAGRLYLEYIAAPADQICWEYLRAGGCPRPNCRWTHAVLEVFIITIAMEMRAPATPAHHAGVHFVQMHMPQAGAGYVCAALPPVPLDGGGWQQAEQLGCWQQQAFLEAAPTFPLEWQQQAPCGGAAAGAAVGAAAAAGATPAAPPSPSPATIGGDVPVAAAVAAGGVDDDGAGAGGNGGVEQAELATALPERPHPQQHQLGAGRSAERVAWADLEDDNDAGVWGRAAPPGP